MKIAFGRAGEEIGEYPEESVPALLQSGVLRRDDLFWHEGLPSWTPVSSRWPTAAEPPVATVSTDQRYRSELKQALAAGWILLSEGPSGAQLELPKKMRTQTQVALILGVVLLFAYGLGLILIIVALIDYAIQKKETKFVSRI